MEGAGVPHVAEPISDPEFVPVVLPYFLPRDRSALYVRPKGIPLTPKHAGLVAGILRERRPRICYYFADQFPSTGLSLDRIAVMVPLSVGYWPIFETKFGFSTLIAETSSYKENLEDPIWRRVVFSRENGTFVIIVRPDGEVLHEWSR